MIPKYRAFIKAEKRMVEVDVYDTDYKFNQEESKYLIESRITEN